MRRIKEECDAAGVKVAFEKVSTGFQVTFYRSEAETTSRKAEKSSEKGSEKSSEKIIRVIRENPTVSAQEIASMLALSSRAIEKHLSKLKEKGVLKRIGPDKGGHWEVLKG